MWVHNFKSVFQFLWINTQKLNCEIIQQSLFLIFLRSLCAVFHSGYTNLIPHQQCTTVSFHSTCYLSFDNSHSFFKKKNNLFMFGCWVFVTARGLSLAMVSRELLQLKCTGFSLLYFSCCKHRLQGMLALLTAARGLSSCSPWSPEYWLISYGTQVSHQWQVEVFPNQALNQSSQHCKGDLPTSGSSTGSCVAI